MRKPLEVDEWYHCYNRGTDKRRVFQSKADYRRFLALLYLCNGTKNIRLAELYDPRLETILADERIDRGDALVRVGAYSLMPNHVHFVFQEAREGGIAAFMQKVFTGYTMYFNVRYDRTGALFAGTYKSKHLRDDDYFKHCIAYVLLNPAELFDRRWKEGRGDRKRIERRIRQYPFSSLPDFIGDERPEGKIINVDMDDWYDRKPALAEMLDDAHAYYREQHPST